MKLSNETLHMLPGTVAVPTYDRASLTPGIIHIGLGNFHRAHQAWYLHRLMQQGQAQDWAIIGAGVRPYDQAMRDKLLAQDCLSTLIELDPSGTTAEVTGAMIDYLPIEDGNGPLIRAMADPRIRIVSLTITESGYYSDPTKGFDDTHPDIQHDIVNPDRPRSVFGAIVAALAVRRAAGNSPFTVQSCDNLQGNGKITRNAILSVARLIDPDLALWINTHGAFPDSMVDCIVPATGPQELQLVKTIGIDDAAPVSHENYRQWVIEDDFCAGRPDWDKVGATLTQDVHDYETMKIRILNAGHQVLANAGELLSVDTIAGCMTHPDIAALFRKVQNEEIAPYVKPVPGMDPSAYIALIESRFANPEIHDTSRRVAYDGSSRHPGFVLPILRDALDADGQIDGLCLVEALWARMCAGTRENGAMIEANDPLWADLVTTAQAAQTAPNQWLHQHHIYGDLSENPEVTRRFAHWLTLIWSQGATAAIRQYCG